MIDRTLYLPFDVDFQEAVQIQKNLKNYLSFQFPFRSEDIHFVAGIDVSYKEKDIACAVIVTLTFPELELVEVAYSLEKIHFPYVPGFLSFREGPAVELSFQRLKKVPQIFFFDGQGIAHPRGLGLASHLGVLFNVVSIGVAKSLLIGQYQEPPTEKGTYSWIYSHNQVVGAALRTREKVRPVFVSPGHRIDLYNTIDWTIRVTGKYRIPEPTRFAHLYANKIKRNEVVSDEIQ